MSTKELAYMPASGSDGIAKASSNGGPCRGWVSSLAYGTLRESLQLFSTRAESETSPASSDLGFRDQDNGDIIADVHWSPRHCQAGPVKEAVEEAASATAPYSFSNVSIHTIEHVDAPRVVTSEKIMGSLGLVMRLAGIKPEALERITGIREHRLWEEGTTTVQAATMAAEKALAASGLEPSKIGVIVNTSVSRDYYEPSVACCVHRALGLSPSCVSFDITNACVGMLNGMTVVASMIEAGVCDYGMVVCAEVVQGLQATTIRRLRFTTSAAVFREQMATLTLGCGGAALVMCRSDLAPEGHNHRFTGGVFRSATHCSHMCVASPTTMITQTRPMRVEGEVLFKRTWDYAKEALGWETEDLEYVVPHQVSNKIHEICSRVTGVPRDRLATFYPELGNVGPAGIGIALSRAEKGGEVKPGMRVGLFGIGSGLHCFMGEVIW